MRILLVENVREFTTIGVQLLTTQLWDSEQLFSSILLYMLNIISL